MKPDSTSAQPPLLEIRDLRTWFPIRRGVFSARAGWIKAVDGVSLALAPRETLGLVGESGCGKTTLARTVADLERAQGGAIRFKNEDLLHADAARRRALRRGIQMVFQDPYASLNPRMTVLDLVTEGLVEHGLLRGGRGDEAERLLGEVGLGPDAMLRYPFEFSGGQRQRICLARAMSVRPELLLCDEAVSALDVSVQAQALNLLMDLREKHALSLVFISHDLSVIKHVSDRVAVMYLGRVVEEGPVEAIMERPLHPYTQALISAVLIPGRKRGPRQILPGEIPSSASPPPGCNFHPRCPKAMARCRTEAPAERAVSGCRVRCHLYSGESHKQNIQ